MYNDPIELFEAIKQLALNYQESFYEMEINNDTQVNILLFKQKEEPQYKYGRKPKTAREIAKSHLGGPVCLIKHIHSKDEYKEDDLDKKQERSD